MGNKCQKHLDEASDTKVKGTGKKAIKSTRKQSITDPSYHTDELSTTSSADEEETVQQQILQQLKRVNARLDAVKDQVASTSGSRQKPHGLSKLSSSSHKSKSKSSSVRCHSTSSESDSDSDTSLPKLSALRSSVSLQRQVDARLRDLESSQDETGMPKCRKIKSKRGGPVDVLVKHKIAWSYDAILVG